MLLLQVLVLPLVQHGLVLLLVLVLEAVKQLSHCCSKLLALLQRLDCLGHGRQEVSRFFDLHGRAGRRKEVCW